jgi:hypothetical protein
VAPSGGARDETGVVRVSIHDPRVGAAIIEFVVIGRDRRTDRRLARSTDPMEICRAVCGWLNRIASNGAAGIADVDEADRTRGQGNT